MSISLKKIAAVAAMAATTLAFTSAANAIVVGGIDFGAIGADPSKNHLETATLAQTFVNGSNQAAMAYGVISTVNGDSSYCADGSSNCALYYVTTTTTRSFTGTYASFGNTVVTIYYDATGGLNLLNQSSASNLTYIQGLSVWASFAGAAGVDLIDPAADQNGTGTLTGQSLSVSGTGLLSVNTGDALGLAAVESYLDTNSIGAFGGNPNADVIFTTSANNFQLNENDVANGSADSCQTANQVVGEWCYQGTANFRGKTNPVPAPGTLALVGIALAGLGLGSRLKRRVG